jgi:hypothetical protein
VGRAKVLFWLATAAAVTGVVLRTGADAWSRNITRSGPGWSSVTQHSAGHHEFYSTIGWLLVGLAVALYAVVAHRWVGRDGPPQGGADAEPDAAPDRGGE